MVEAADGSKQVVIVVAVIARGCCYVPCPLADCGAPHGPAPRFQFRSNFVDLMSTTTGLAGGRDGIAVIPPPGRTRAST